MQTNAEPILSFEFFPPRSPEGLANLVDAAKNLAVCNPSFFSVTFGAGGSTRAGTFETVALLNKETGVNVAPHLACIGTSKQDVRDILMQYQAAGIRRLVALRGDIPSGMVNAGDLHYSSELVALIRRETGDDFYIEVAAYPEFHPQAKTMADDVMNLRRKYDAGANSAITQYFFNPDSYFYFLEDCERAGIHMPVVPGIMPITQFSNLARFSDACGAEIPRWIRKRLESYGDDINSIQKFGLEVVTKLCERLLDGGAPGLHFYTLNKDKASLEIIHRLNTLRSTKNLSQFTTP